ncbi:TPA: type VI secretion system ATPase TssH, partial [Candidatus Beckwithbacteria bacterium]|nr:type VI secretion system ATPase TssH [Candidatus Beckwithbacteria bacterium]
ALERRFQPVLINPPSVADTVSILRGLKEKYEVHHGIKITDDAVVAAAKLSDRYIADRFLPDKAIDLVDEATSGLKIESESQPEELDQLKRQITQLEIEQAALKKEKSKTAQARLAEIKKNLAPLKEKETKLKLRWASQKELLTKIQKLQGQADELKTRLETLEREVKLEEAAKIKYGDLPQIEKELTKLQETWEKIPDEDKILKLSVTEEDIAQVVSRWSGVPVAKLLSTEAEKLAHLEDELHQRVVNQDEAVREVAGAIRRSRAGISEETRPIGSFIFMGPTGVGKTELAKALAEVLFGDEKALVRTDMSEYSESHSLARLIGAPPGYVGFEEGGQLTEAVRRKPYSVILFDEIEKAHPQIFNAFLQILDEGRLTDGKGRTISFKNTVVIMTDNLGGNIIQDYAGKKDKQEEMKQKIWELVNQSFRPEFINRLDQIIIFDQLTPEMLNSIVKLQLDRVNRRLADKKITLKVTPAAEKYLSQKGFDDAFGARPLKRVIQNEILDPLSLMIIENKVKEGTTVTIDAAKGALTLKA